MSKEFAGKDLGNTPEKVLRTRTLITPTCENATNAAGVGIGIQNELVAGEPLVVEYFFLHEVLASLIEHDSLKLLSEKRN